MNKRVKEMPVSERPYEKSLKYGVEVLSDAELLAVIIRCGTRSLSSVELAREVLEQCGGREGIASLERRSVEELKKIKGIGSVKAIQLKALNEFAKRLWKSRIGTRERFTTPSVIARYYMEDMRRLAVEEVRIMCLDNSCALIKDFVLSRGTVNASMVSVRDVFLNALKYEAVKLIMVHNHPSGDPTPSKEDILITQKMIRAGVLMDLRLADSIVIGDGIYISIREKRLADFY